MRAALFTPDGKHVAGFVIKRPDVAGMIKRGDAFLAWDSLRVLDEKTILVTRADDGLDDAALRRLDLDWDRCIMWSGMDAKDPRPARHSATSRRGVRREDRRRHPLLHG